jgi:SAM-dependent methyltransferase
MSGTGPAALGSGAPAEDELTEVGGRPLTPRQLRMYRLFDPTTGKGLEIGPLHMPVVPRSTGDVHYVDVHDLAGLQDAYRDHEGFPLDAIQAPDYVLIGPDGMRPLPEAVAPGAPFAWVVASHVVEHVPDVVTWLREIAEVLEDGGLLVLAVPDRRLCFDAERDPTTVGEMLRAHRSRDLVPSVRAVYDHFSRCVHIDPVHIWHGEQPGQRMYGSDYVMAKVAEAEAGRYVDCHVWVWTPASFVAQLAELASLDLLDFVVERVVDPDVDDLEFFARLRRLPRGESRDERHAARAAGLQEWTDIVLPLPPEPSPPEDTPVGGGLHDDLAGVAASLSGSEATLVLAKRRALYGARRAARLLRR